MRKSRFSEEQILGILKEHQAGMPVANLCRKRGISDATLYAMVTLQRQTLRTRYCINYAL